MEKHVTPNDLNIKCGEHVPPKNGWEQRTYYIVDVAFSSNNIIHRTVFYSGFLFNGIPCGYNKFLNYTNDLEYKDAWYIKAICSFTLENPNMKFV